MSDDLAPDEHTHDLVRVDEGEDVILVTHDGNHIGATCTEQHVENTETVHIMERKTARFERHSDGETLLAMITDGLRGNDAADPFPWYTELAVESQLPRTEAEESPEGTYLGYVAEVRR